MKYESLDQLKQQQKSAVGWCGNSLAAYYFLFSYSEKFDNKQDKLFMGWNEAATAKRVKNNYVER